MELCVMLKNVVIASAALGFTTCTMPGAAAVVSNVVRFEARAGARNHGGECWGRNLDTDQDKVTGNEQKTFCFKPKLYKSISDNFRYALMRLENCMTMAHVLIHQEWRWLITQILKWKEVRRNFLHAKTGCNHANISVGTRLKSGPYGKKLQ